MQTIFHNSELQYNSKCTFSMPINTSLYFHKRKAAFGLLIFLKSFLQVFIYRY